MKKQKRSARHFGLKALLLLLSLVMLFASLSACQAPADTGGTTVEGDKDSYAGRKLDVLFMVGGQGQMADPILAKLEEVLPGLETTIVYDHKAADILRRRVMADDPPDIFDVNSGFYDYYAAISEGVCKPLDFLYDVPCVDDPSKTLGDILAFPMMTFGFVDGKHYCMSDSIFTSGLWYDANMFKEKGYAVPETWDEFYALGEKAKADGKYLLSYSTRSAAEYFYQYWFNPLLTTLSLEAFGKTQNPAADSWSDPAVRKALELTKDLVDKGYVETMSGTLVITELQMQFCNGNILFYPCGSWLEAEMGDNWPDGFDLTYLPFPTQKKGEASYLHVTGVVSAVSAKTKNEDLVKEYYRYMLSNKETMEKVIGITMNGLPVKDFSTNFGSLLPSSTASSWAAIDSGRVIGYRAMAPSFYPSLGPVINDKISGLTLEGTSVDEVIDALNGIYAQILADDSITKREYDLSSVMEALANYNATK
ncbi:MAG: extracellular solute-binding protein [Clostridiaceae bacterium]|nr:extracellular solute-binding protein [Clostridiaceae bacterium]